MDFKSSLLIVQRTCKDLYKMTQGYNTLISCIHSSHKYRYLWIYNSCIDYFVLISLNGDDVLWCLHKKKSIGCCAAKIVLHRQNFGLYLLWIFFLPGLIFPIFFIYLEFQTELIVNFLPGCIFT